MERLRNIPIREFMVTDVVSLTPGETMADAYQKMKNHGIRHLPVIDANKKVIGVFTQADLDRANPPRETETGWYYDKNELLSHNLPHFTTPDPTTLTPENTLKDAAESMARNKFGSIPIVLSDSGELVGIVTYVDILRKVAGLFKDE